MTIHEQRWVGVGDDGKYIYWPSVASTKMQCRAIIYHNLYVPFNDKVNWKDWELVQIEIKSLPEVPDEPIPQRSWGAEVLEDN